MIEGAYRGFQHVADRGSDEAWNGDAIDRVYLMMLIPSRDAAEEPSTRWPARSRRFYAVAVAVTIGLGLGSRAIATHLPWWLAKNAGDVLYATMVVFGLGLFAPRIRARTAAVIALAICVAVEASQAIHTPSLDSVRATLPGRLVLGQGFHAFDLVCYAVGVALAIVVLELRRGHRPTAAVRTAAARAPRTGAR